MTPGGDAAAGGRAGALQIGVMGAGSVGCFLGGALAISGADVVMVGRPGLEEVIAARGLEIAGLGASTTHLPPGAVRYGSRPEILADRDLVLVTVKGHDVEEAAEGLAPFLAPGAVVVSLQNGVEGRPVLRRHLSGHEVLAGVVTFNVVRGEGAFFRMATSGPLVVQGGSEAGGALVRCLRRAGIAAAEHADISAVLWGKLIFNLNNALNALCGRPLAEQIADRSMRRLMAATMREGLVACRKAGIRPGSIGRMIPGLAARLLPLPDGLYRLLSGSMVHVHPDARSSMWDDLERGRPTEVDLLNGVVVDLGIREGIPTPANRALVELVHEAEAAGEGSPELPTEEIERRLRGR